MHPYLFWIGNFPLPLFGLMAALGFLLAIRYLRGSFKTLGVHEEQVFDFALVIMIAALVGSRVVYLFVEWDDFLARPFSMIFSRQGYVFYGGFSLRLLRGSWLRSMERVAGPKECRRRGACDRSGPCHRSSGLFS